jgi:hypothetical protein
MDPDQTATAGSATPHVALPPQRLMIASSQGAATSPVIAIAPPRRPRAESGSDTASAAESAAGQSESAAPDQVVVTYRRRLVKGQEFFCRTEQPTGSRVDRQYVCLTRREIEARQEASQRFMQDVQRAGGVGTDGGGGGGQTTLMQSGALPPH